MANVLYSKGRQKFLEGSIHWLTDTIKVCFIDTANYTFSDTHEFLSDVIGSPDPRVGTDQTLATKTSTSGVADAADAVFPSVTGASVEAMIIYKDSDASPQDEASCPLIAYLDSAAGLPFTPAGIDQTVVWDNGANKIFKL